MAEARGKLGDRARKRQEIDRRPAAQRKGTAGLYKTAGHQRETQPTTASEYGAFQRTPFFSSRWSPFQPCLHMVLRRTKSPTPTAGPNRVATTSIKNDLPSITQQTPHSTHPPARPPTPCRCLPMLRGDPSPAKQGDNTTRKKFPHPLFQFLPQCYLAQASLYIALRRSVPNAEFFVYAFQYFPIGNCHDIMRRTKARIGVLTAQYGQRLHCVLQI